MRLNRIPDNRPAGMNTVRVATITDQFGVRTPHSNPKIGLKNFSQGITNKLSILNRIRIVGMPWVSFLRNSLLDHKLPRAFMMSQVEMNMP